MAADDDSAFLKQWKALHGGKAPFEGLPPPRSEPIVPKGIPPGTRDTSTGEVAEAPDLTVINAATGEVHGTAVWGANDAHLEPVEMARDPVDLDPYPEGVDTQPELFNDDEVENNKK